MNGLISNPAWMETKALQLVELYSKENLYDIEILPFADLKKTGS